MLLGLIAILFFFNVAMTCYRSAALTLLADYTPAVVRSKGSGLQQLIANRGAIYAFLLPTLSALLRLGISTFDARYLGFPITGAVMIVILAVLFKTIKKTSPGDVSLKIGDTPIKIHSLNSPVLWSLFPGGNEGAYPGIYYAFNLVACFRAYHHGVGV